MRDLGNKTKTARINFILGCLILAYLVILGRLYYIQITKGEHYKAWAQGLQVFSKEPSVERGEIFFKDGQPLAINKNYYYVFASPPNVKDAPSAAKVLAGILKSDEKDVLERLSKDALYSPIKAKLSEEEAKVLQEAALPGIYVRTRKLRYYPQGNLASQVSGFVDDNYEGKYGIEEYYDSELSRGQDLVLSLDYNIQYKAEELLAEGVKKLNAQSAEAIVADPRTGDILAMAKIPNFDPNNFQEYAADPEQINLFKNDSCQTLFEPGSVFKAVTMASALNEGKVTPETKYDDNGVLQIGGWPIYNYNQRTFGPSQTMTNVLEHSINTGAVFAKNRIGNAVFEDYIERFGFFEPTGIDLPETYSQNLEFKKGYEINYATAAFGQGIELTSVQLVRAYCALANGGKLVRLSLAGSAGKDSDEYKPREVIKREAANDIAKMLASVIENGYSKKAKIPGYYIAGKTGTAQMSWSVYGIEKRGYSDKTMQSFIGWLPAYDPKFLILVKIKAPETNTAEYSAMPIFHELARHIVYLYQVPPDTEIEQKGGNPPSPQSNSSAVQAALDPKKETHELAPVH